MKSGTSIACSVVAGVAALLKAKYPTWSPAAIGSANMTTTSPLDDTMKPIRVDDFLAETATPLAVGGGMIDPNRALDQGLIIRMQPLKIMLVYYAPQVFSKSNSHPSLNQTLAVVRTCPMMMYYNTDI